MYLRGFNKGMPECSGNNPSLYIYCPQIILFEQKFGQDHSWLPQCTLTGN